VLDVKGIRIEQQNSDSGRVPITAKSLDSSKFFSNNSNHLERIEQQRASISTFEGSKLNPTGTPYEPIKF
jgi:hypothetical protein